MKREFLTQFMERLIVELEREQRDGTAHVYQSTLKRLKKFANGREVSFKQLTRNGYLNSSGNCWPTN